MKKNTEVIEQEGKLNEVIILTSQRKNKSVRVQQDFQFCPTLTEQHTGHLTDLNYLVSKYKPDELAAYIAAKSAHRQEIVGHDFSQEPSLQDANNEVYRIKKAFEQIPEEIRSQFRNHVEFLKFIDNPANQEKMIKLGLLDKQEIANLTTTPQTTTKEEDKKAE